MKEKETDSHYKSLIEKGRNNPSVMEICHHEYLAEYGVLPSDNWVPSDEEILSVIKHIGIDEFTNDN